MATGPASGLPVLLPEGLQEVTPEYKTATQQKREQIQRKQSLSLDGGSAVPGGHGHLGKPHHRQDSSWRLSILQGPPKLAGCQRFHTSWRVTRRLSVGELDKGVQPG